MNTNLLREWIVANNVEETIIKYFDEEFKLYRIDNLDVFTKKFPTFDETALTRYLYKVALTIIGWGESEQECIIAFVRINYRNSYVGEYRLVYSFEGEILNEYLVIE